MPTKRTYWVGEGAAILIADELQALRADAVGREQRVAAFEQLRLPLNGTSDARDDDPCRRGGRRDRLVLGRVSLDDQRLTLASACWISTPAATTPTWSSRAAPPGPVRHRTAPGEACRSPTSPEAPSRPRRDRRRPPSPALEAFESYVKGLLDERPEARLRLLKAALARQPDLDRAWLAIWEVHAATGSTRRRSAAVKSVPGRRRPAAGRRGSSRRDRCSNSGSTTRRSRP